MIEGTSYLSATRVCELLTRCNVWKNIYANEYTLIYYYKSYILKVSRGESIKAMEREFRVGLALNESHHTAIIRTYAFGYGIADKYTKCHPFIIVEYVNGKTLSCNLANALISDEQKITVIRHIIYSLIELQEVEEFTHYDLHAGNIILEEIPPTMFHFVNGDRVVDTITTTLLPRFIDYAYVHTKRVSGDSKAYMSATDIRRAPGIFDAFIDIQFVCAVFKMYLHYDFGEGWAVNPVIDIEDVVQDVPRFVRQKINTVTSDIAEYNVVDLIACYEVVLATEENVDRTTLDKKFYKQLGAAINRTWMERRNRDRNEIMDAIVPFFAWLRIIY